MSQESEQPAPDQSLRDALQTRHPGINNEIQGAINTLRKIQQIAGPSSRAPRDEPSIASHATTDGSVGSDGQFLAPSESFGRYQIVRLLGQGAMGAVYLAYDPQLERHVALKTPFIGNNPITIERFYREARAAAQLRSPYVCTVYDVGQLAGIYYISMAFIDGQPLDKLIAEGKLKDPRRIADITKKIARGLQKAHEQGIMHRDLKPANLMIDTDGEPIVMDFGLARKVEEDTSLTTPGKILGTPAYMSPEQVDGDPKKIGHSTDIYSLGVVLYQMLTGRVPFLGSFTSILHKIAHEQPQKPSTICTDLATAAPLESICLKMMAKSPTDRYPSMAAVADALDDAFPREGQVAPQPSAWKKLSGAAKRFFAFGSRNPKPPTPAADAPKPGAEISVTDKTAASGSVFMPIPAVDATQLTPGSGAADKPAQANDATLLPGSAPGPDAAGGKPIKDIDATQQTTEY
jgi:serine/threonine protein kinase